jgi:hypothetical protein
MPQSKATPITFVDSLLLKPEWLRAPSWRWSVIQSYLADPVKSNAPIQSDKFLTEAVQYYKDRKKFVKDPAKVKKAHPESSLAFELYSNNRPGGWRWYIEALMMTGTSIEDIQKALKVDCPVDALNIFRNVFFDITPYIESEIAVYANVLSTSRVAAANPDNHDYTWKMFAYCWGADDFIKRFCFKAKEQSKEHREWFKMMAASNIALNSYHASSDLRLMYNNQAVEVLRLAQTYWSVDPDSTKTADSMVGNSVVSNVQKHIDLTLLDAEKKMSAVEGRLLTEFADFSFN